MPQAVVPRYIVDAPGVAPSGRAGRRREGQGRHRRARAGCGAPGRRGLASLPGRLHADHPAQVGARRRHAEVEGQQPVRRPARLAGRGAPDQAATAGHDRRRPGWPRAGDRREGAPGALDADELPPHFDKLVASMLSAYADDPKAETGEPHQPLSAEGMAPVTGISSPVTGRPGRRPRRSIAPPPGRTAGAGPH